MTKKPKTKEPFTITLTPAVKAGIILLAHRRGVSRSTLIELLLRKELAKEKIPLPPLGKESPS